MYMDANERVDYGLPKGHDSEEPNRTLRALTEFDLTDYKVFLGVPTRYSVTYSETNFYHDYSLVFENRTRRPIFIRNLNGLVQKLDPMVGNWAGEFLDIFENIDTDSLGTQATNTYGEEIITPYVLLRKENRKHGGTISNENKTYAPSKKHWAICRRIEKKVISNSDKGIVLEGLPIMVFDTELEAIQATFDIGSISTSSDLDKNKVGMEICISSPSTRYTSFFTPYMDGIKKIKVKRTPGRSDGTVTINVTDADGHLSKSRYTIAELTEGEGKEGFRLDETEQEAHVDSRRPLSADSKVRLEKEDNEFQAELLKLRLLHTTRRKGIDVALKADLLQQKTDNDVIYEKAKRLHEEDMDELRAERKTYEKLTAAEREKQKNEDRWKKAKDSTSIFAKMTDALASLIGFVIKIFA